MKPFLIKNIVSPIILTVLLAACGGGGGGSDSGSDGSAVTPTPSTPGASPTKAISSFGPKVDGSYATVAAATFEASATEDGAPSPLAKVSFDVSTGQVDIRDGKSVRGYEISFLLADGVSISSVKDGGFIGLDAGATEGILTTISTTGSGNVALAGVKLVASDGSLVPVSIN
ncbi:hypothetical protein H4F20_06935 [Vibrio sp. 16]|uniref:hypothetical protein n=1 Tax=Vibrio sp. 16 TaxID=391586 RepID=UPI002FF00E57